MTLKDTITAVLLLTCSVVTVNVNTTNKLMTAQLYARAAEPVEPATEETSTLLEFGKVDYSILEVKDLTEGVTNSSPVPAKTEPENKPEPETKKESTLSIIQDGANDDINERLFLHGGKYRKGSYLIEIVKNNKNGKLFYDAFEAKYSTRVANIMSISLMFENATMLETTVGVCNKKYQIKGDYRNCVYADRNSAGMDAGVKQINTYYQASRITKLGGPDCIAKNSRDIKDSCTRKLVDWLLIPENNLKISLDIYSDSGFSPWYGYKKAFPVGIKI